MSRLRFALLLLAIPLLVSFQDYGGAAHVGLLRGPPIAGGGGQAFSDDFNRANDTDVNALCGSCSWTEVEGNWAILSNELSLGAEDGQISFGSTDTLAQYVGAKYSGTVGDPQAGLAIRTNGNTSPGTSDCWYTFRQIGSTSFQLRACRGGHNCSSIQNMSPGDLGMTTMDSGDSFGMSITGDSGNDVTFTLYGWEAASPSTDFTDWATGADGTWTVCASGCDDTWSTAPVTALSNAGCVDNADNVDNDQIGLYSGNANATEWDDWRGGDVP